MQTAFHILVVCTGNVCRSPQAAQLISARASEISPHVAPQLVVESAGTAALVGASMPTEAATISVAHGGTPADHVARQVTADMVRDADLVLAMAAEHRSAVVRLLPRASRYTFTLTEFAALLDNAADNSLQASGDWSALDPADKLRAAVGWAASRRGFLSADDETVADVVDPYRRSKEIYEESARQILAALDRTQGAATKLVEQVSA